MLRSFGSSIEESLSGPRLVSATARRNGISNQLLFSWRKAYREGRLGAIDGFVPATIVPEHPEGGSGPGCGRIEIVSANLECRTVVPARSLRHQISCSAATLAAFRQKLHLAYRPNLPGHLCSSTAELLLANMRRFFGSRSENALRLLRRRLTLDRRARNRRIFLDQPLLLKIDPEARRYLSP